MSVRVIVLALIDIDIKIVGSGGFLALGQALQVVDAGSVFIGKYTPESAGDYASGTNHVLPTARSARFSSGLSVTDFMKRTSFVECGPDGLAAVGPAATTLAQAEGLDAHAHSVAIRLNRR